MIKKYVFVMLNLSFLYLRRKKGLINRWLLGRRGEVIVLSNVFYFDYKYVGGLLNRILE